MKIVSCLIFWWFNATTGLDISVYYHLSSGIHTLFLIGIHFGINWKTNNYRPIIIIARSNISFYCEQFFFCIKRLSCSSNSSPANAGNCTLESSILKTSWRNMLPGTTFPSPCTCITNGTSPPAEPLLSVLTILKVYFFLLVCRMKDLWCSYHFIKATWIISYSPLSLLQGT